MITVFETIVTFENDVQPERNGMTAVLEVCRTENKVQTTVKRYTLNKTAARRALDDFVTYATEANVSGSIVAQRIYRCHMPPLTGKQLMLALINNEIAPVRVALVQGELMVNPDLTLVQGELPVAIAEGDGVNNG